MHAIRVLLAIALVGLAAPSLALDDTPENRATQVARLLAAMPPEAMLRDMAENVAMTLPADDREDFIRVMTELVDVGVLRAAMEASMLRHFTADELDAMATLYESPDGQSAMQKMGVYMADVMPVIQAEVARAFAELQRSRGQN